MQLEGIGVTQPDKHGPIQLRLKFGKQAYCVVEIRRGEDAAEVAKKLRELAGQVEKRTGDRLPAEPSLARSRARHVWSANTRSALLWPS